MTSCDHCGRPWEMGGLVYRGGTRFNLCHPSETNRPDCYHLVTVYGEQVGTRMEEL